MNRLPLILALPVLALGACNAAPPDRQDRVQAQGAAPKEVPVSRADGRLPTGFDLYIGQRGERDLEIAPAGKGMIATWAVLARPEDVVAYYEHAGSAAGLSVVGRVTADDYVSLDMRRTGAGKPHTMSVTTSQKSDYTTVALKFDVTA